MSDWSKGMSEAANEAERRYPLMSRGDDAQTYRQESFIAGAEWHSAHAVSLPDRETLLEALFYVDDRGRHVFRYADHRATLEDDPYLRGMIPAILPLLSRTPQPSLAALSTQPAAGLISSVHDLPWFESVLAQSREVLSATAEDSWPSWYREYRSGAQPAAGATDEIPEADATSDEAFELGCVSGYDEAMREVAQPAAGEVEEIPDDLSYEEQYGERA